MYKVHLTPSALNAYAVALATKTPVDLTHFKVADAYGYDGEGAVDLRGNPSYTGKISSIEMLSENSVRLVLNVPRGIPASGTMSIGEIGVYLSTGELFGIAVFDEAAPKSKDWDFEIDLVLTHSRLAGTINLNVAENASLPATFSSYLPAPGLALGNTWAVLDAQQNADLPQTSGPTVAIRHGIGGSGFQWGLVGFSRVYRGTPPAVAADRTSFQMDPGRNGWWCNDREVVVVMSQTEARRFRYRADTYTFSLIDAEPFSVFNQQTEIRIWRQHSNENALPSRKNVPQHYVLHPGQDSWDSHGHSRQSYDLVQATFTLQADGVRRVWPLPVDGRVVGGLVFHNGRLLPTSDYALEGTLSLLSPIEGNVTAHVWHTIPTGGSETVLTEDTWLTQGDADTFTLSTVPGAYNRLLVFDSGRLVGAEHYDVRGTSLILDYRPRGRLTAVTMRPRQKPGLRTRLFHQRWVADGSTRQYQTNVPIESRHQTLLFAGGIYQVKESYGINGTALELEDAPAHGLPLELWVFTAEEADVGHLHRQGQNTGPVWRDPAGFMTEPCWMDVYQHDATSYDGQQSFPVPVEYRHLPSQNIWFYLNGLCQNPKEWEWENGTIKWRVPLKEGQQLTAVIWVPFEGPGYQTNMKTVNWQGPVVGHGALTLPATPESRLDRGVLVFAGGLLQAKNVWSLSGASIKLTPQQADYQVWVLTHEPMTDGTAEPRRFGGIRNLPEDVQKANLWPQINGLCQYPEAYNLNDRTLTYVNRPPADTEQTVAYLYTGKPRTRLVTRDELEAALLNQGD